MAHSCSIFLRPYRLSAVENLKTGRTGEFFGVNSGSAQSFSVRNHVFRPSIPKRRTERLVERFCLLRFCRQSPFCRLCECICDQVGSVTDSVTEPVANPGKHPKIWKSWNGQERRDAVTKARDLWVISSEKRSMRIPTYGTEGCWFESSWVYFLYLQRVTSLPS